MSELGRRCFHCKRLFTTKQGLGLHLSALRRATPARRDVLCPDRRTTEERFATEMANRLERAMMGYR